jgi:hypothetical protein
VKQSALAGAGLAHNREHLSPFNCKRQILKEHQFSRARTEGLLKAFDPQRLLS